MKAADVGTPPATKAADVRTPEERKEALESARVEDYIAWRGREGIGR